MMPTDLVTQRLRRATELLRQVRDLVQRSCPEAALSAYWGPWLSAAADLLVELAPPVCQYCGGVAARERGRNAACRYRRTCGQPACLKAARTAAARSWRGSSRALLTAPARDRRDHPGGQS